ncbi:methionyl-tRNA formyltransferase [Liquorilactobacillus uvarum]|uniref:methionyl-tRNA formyltransferase n=1 Tax=Liquorilactobacillus uvarum TaxID=303240 RepID=UPI002889AFF6|nr:methionyl-tRNA formyltransferase [Liquorilactobacillus uvarum]
MTSVVFMGTPEFAAVILKGLIKNNYHIKAVVTQPDRYTGRKHKLTASPVKQVALENKIKVLQPEKIAGSTELEQVVALAPDLIVTAAFGQFLPNKLIEAAKVGAINVHGSLLPKYRGGAPVQYAIMNGEKKTGVTIIFMIKKMDAGNMLAQAELPITKTDDTGTIFEKMSILGRDLLLKTIPNLIADKIQAKPQNDADVTFSPIITPEQEELHLNQKAQELDWKIRALRPAPGAYFKMFNGKRTKLWQITPLEEKTALEAGCVVAVDKHQLKIAAAEGTVYQVDTIQPAGKPRMKVTDYLNGVGQNIQLGQKVIENDK